MKNFNAKERLIAVVQAASLITDLSDNNNIIKIKRSPNWNARSKFRTPTYFERRNIYIGYNMHDLSATK